MNGSLCLIRGYYQLGSCLGEDLDYTILRNSCTCRNTYRENDIVIVRHKHRELPYELRLRPYEDIQVDTNENWERMENSRTSNGRQIIHILQISQSKTF